MQEREKSITALRKIQNHGAVKIFNSFRIQTNQIKIPSASLDGRIQKDENKQTLLRE
jgi:hypothetical protein